MPRLTDLLGEDVSLTRRQRIELPIFAAIFLYLWYILFETVQLRPAARQVPLYIVSAGLVLVLARIVTLLRPGLLPRMDLMGNTGVAEERRSGPSVDISLSARAIAVFAAYVVLLFVLDLVLATAAFVFAFLYYYEDRSLRFSAVTAIATMLFVYVTFRVVLNVRDFGLITEYIII